MTGGGLQQPPEPSTRGPEYRSNTVFAGGPYYTPLAVYSIQHRVIALRPAAAIISTGATRIYTRWPGEKNSGTTRLAENRTIRVYCDCRDAFTGCVEVCKATAASGRPVHGDNAGPVEHESGTALTIDAAAAAAANRHAPRDRSLPFVARAASRPPQPTPPRPPLLLFRHERRPRTVLNRK